MHSSDVCEDYRPTAAGFPAKSRVTPATIQSLPCSYPYLIALTFSRPPLMNPINIFTITDYDTHTIQILIMIFLAGNKCVELRSHTSKCFFNNKINLKLVNLI